MWERPNGAGGREGVVITGGEKSEEKTGECTKKTWPKNMNMR